MNMPGFTAVALLSRKPVRYQSTGRASATGFRGGVVPALPIGEGGTVIKNDLENQGYTCEVVSVGFWEVRLSPDLRPIGVMLRVASLNL